MPDPDAEERHQVASLVTAAIVCRGRHVPTRPASTPSPSGLTITHKYRSHPRPLGTEAQIDVRR